jgi:hypothetical protein
MQESKLHEPGCFISDLSLQGDQVEERYAHFHAPLLDGVTDMFHMAQAAGNVRLEETKDLFYAACRIVCIKQPRITFSQSLRA